MINKLWTWYVGDIDDVAVGIGYDYYDNSDHVYLSAKFVESEFEQFILNT